MPVPLEMLGTWAEETTRFPNDHATTGSGDISSLWSNPSADVEMRRSRDGYGEEC